MAVYMRLAAIRIVPLRLTRSTVCSLLILLGSALKLHGAMKMTIRVSKFSDWRLRPQEFGPRQLSYIVLAVLAVLVFGTFLDYGIAWDEHVQAVYGHLLLSYYQSLFHDQSAFQYTNMRYFGGGFDLVAAAANAISPFGEYETRHLLGGLVGLAGFFGAWRLTNLLAGERAAFFALLLLALTPLMYGHDFFNPKDAPLAWALIWAMYFACRAIHELPRPKLGTALGFGFCLGAATGTRAIGFIALLYCLPAFVAYAIGRYRTIGSARDVGRELATFLIALLPALPVAFLVTALFWPWVVQAPGNLKAALMLFAHYPSQGAVLWNGTVYDSRHLPRLYLPFLLVLQLPEVVLVGLGAVSVSATRSLARKGLAHLTDGRSLCSIVLVTAIAVPILYTVIFRPSQSDGVRHFLFVVPPLVILAGIGIDKIFSWALSHGRRIASGFALLLSCFVVAQIATMIELHPDEYVYFNVLAGRLSGASGRFDLDYWGLSLKEAMLDLTSYRRRVEPQLSLKAPWNVFVCGNRNSAIIPPNSNLRLVRRMMYADFAVSIRSPLCDGLVGGRKILEVSRGGSVLSYVSDLRKEAGP